ncbi:DPP IV N-terminal domain-containing protein [Sphingoaurantiacus capsulatus]|uniref:DPP IV N-terminal domain-containing protein n=1 Tax=Sphingoaurantiacus capsulatus TaxID=1771310 RepID=A0ABV7XAE1_9SPHN
MVRQAMMVAALLMAAPAVSAATPEDYKRSLGLREAQMYLTENVVDQAAWAPDGGAFHYRKTVPGGFQFVTVQPATMAKQPAFDQARIATAIGKLTGQTYQPLRLPFASFRYGAGNQSISFTAAGTRYSCNLTSYTCAEPAAAPGRPRAFGITRDMSVPADNTARTSPDGRWQAYTLDSNLMLREVATGAVRLITRNGSDGNFYDPETIAWAPDSSRFAAYRVVPGYQRQVYRVQSSPPGGEIKAKLITQLYPLPGDTVDLERPVVVDVASGAATEVVSSLFANPYSMSPIKWRADSGSFSFAYNQRGHAVYRLVSVDGRTGKASAAVEEKSDTFFYAPRHSYHDVSNLGREIVWMSERDGWNHLYLIDGKTGRTKKQITRGDWVVREIVKVDDEKRQIWFAANGRRKGSDPYLQHYYRVNFDGTNLVELTSADAFHDVAFSPDMQFYVDTYSRNNMATVSELRRGDGSLVSVIERGDITKLVAAGWQAPENFVAKGRDGRTDIWGVIVRPRDFDPAKKYPVIENIYGAGWDQFVPKKFWPFGFHAGGDEVVGMQSLADLGFIVVQIDGMGTLHRSKAFHDHTWKNAGDGGAPDRILWHKAAAQKYAYYDIDRVGLYGGSAGGQNTLNNLLFYPEFYKAGVSYNGCHDNRLDKVTWNEQWSGWPVDESYSKASSVDNAWRLKGNVLLVIGELDMNVDPVASMQVVDALIKANKTFEMLNVPNGDHGVGRTDGPMDYVLARQYDFFIRHLQGVQPPNWNAITDATPPAAR